jgi:hypothetical protein
VACEWLKIGNILHSFSTESLGGMKSNLNINSPWVVPLQN